MSRAILRIGNMLVHGPDTIHKSDNVGSAYVQSSTAIHWNDSSFGLFRSCRIYCDAVGDDESGYLLPMARIAEWNRSADIEIAPLDWPNVDIKLLTLNLDCPEIQAEVASLQKRLDTQILTSYGLPTRRDFGSAKLGPHGQLQIETNAGYQTISRQFWLGEATDFLNTFDSFKAIVNTTGTPTDKALWVERYDHSPAQLAAGTGWDWDCQPMSIRGNSGQQHDRAKRLAGE